MRDLVAVDIGGTHARFALANIGEDGAISLDEPETLHTADHASFQTAWQAYRERKGGTLLYNLPPITDLGIANVCEVGDFCPSANLGVLGLDKGTDLAICAEVSSWA